MEKVLVIVFDSQAKAMEGLQILQDLDSEDDISLYQAQVITKEPSGAVRLIGNADRSIVPMIFGDTAAGALVGLVGGPVGAIVGATGGALVGAFSATEAGFTDEFISDITKALTPGKVAVIADIAEDRVTSLDTRMERIGGVVLRGTRTSEKTSEEDRDAAAHQAEIDELEVQRAQASSDRLAKIDAKIDKLRVKLEHAIERKRVKMQLHQQEREAKIQALQKKADQAEGEARRRLEARIADLRRDYSEKAAVS